jgi:heptosyltransferase-3
VANFPVYLIHNHKPSVGLPFDRDNVELVYQENLETPEVKELILNRVSAVIVHE